MIVLYNMCICIWYFMYVCMATMYVCMIKNTFAYIRTYEYSYIALRDYTLICNS